MNKEKIDNLVTAIVSIEREVIRKKFDTASGLGKKFTKDKIDVDVINKILDLINGEDGSDEN